MVTFLFTAVVLVALIYAGYRVNMYLYSRGAVGASSQVVNGGEPIPLEMLSIRSGQRMVKRERDDGLRYARLYLALVLAFAAILLIFAISAFSSVFH